MATLLRHALSGFFTRGAFNIQSRLLRFESIFAGTGHYLTRLIHPVTGVGLRYPALPVLHPRHDLVRGLDVKTVIGVDYLQGDRVHPVDGNMHMVVLRIPVQAIHSLAPLKPQLVQKNIHQFIHLTGRWLLMRLP